MNLRSQNLTTFPRLAVTLCLASIAPLSAQAPSYPMGQGPFGQPQVQQPAPPQTQPAQSYPSDSTRASGPYQNQRGQSRGWEQRQQGWPQAQAANVAPLAPVQVATPEAKASSLAAMADKPIRSAAQEILGTLTDFLIDPRSGKVEFAVVPGGVDAAGEKYRLIPVGALELNNAAEGLRAKIQPAQWQQVEAIPDRQLRGSISLNPAQRQRLDQQFGLSSNNTPRMQTPLVRASELRGKTLQTWGQQLGVVQDVAIDVRHQVAAALVNPTDSALGAGQMFLVAFSQMQMGRPEQPAINTILTAAHFQQAQAGMPTGATSSSFGSPNASGDTAATAVRHALDRNPSLARANVQVVPETRIRLHGTVQDEQTRSNIERTAKEAAPGMQVDNHITVQGANR